MNKLIVTEREGRILTALLEEGRCRSISLNPKEGQSLVGNIYIGKVKHVLKNINAAFIDLGNGVMGYYSLFENQAHLFAGQPWKRTSCEGGAAGGTAADPKALLAPAPAGNGRKREIRQGDELIVQVSRDAVKTKDPVLTCNLNFTGTYVVLTLGKTQLGFSSKIRDTAWKEAMRVRLAEEKQPDFGLIVRTNAERAGAELIIAEIRALRARMEALLSLAPMRTCYSLLEQAKPPHIQELLNTDISRLECILTDSPDCFAQMKRWLEEEQPGELHRLSFYDDSFPLSKLYSLESVLKEALGKRVWLKSGGYLVIEPTEALTVVDVNTGKYTGKKNVEDTILKINTEAALETARQLRLRNLSGIIIVDFIDMASEENRERLLAILEEELKKDPVKTVLVEMTKLGLVEITRKKVRKPLYEAAAPFKIRTEVYDAI